MAYGVSANETVGNIRYDEVVLGGGGRVVEVRDVWMPTAQSWSPVYSFLSEPFSFDHFTSPRVPVDLGPFDISFVGRVPRVLRLTIKPVGELVAYIPEELGAAEDFILQVLEYERMVNKGFVDCEVHITVDSGFVGVSEVQRFPGWHVDGLQGGKFKSKLLAEHSYIVASNNPTEFCLQPFFVKHYDEDVTNLFKAFDQQARGVNVFRGVSNHLYLMDAYMVHRTPQVLEATNRGFVRVTVANAPLPIEFNTLNPLLGQVRPKGKLDIRDWLRAPDGGVDYEFYGLSGRGGLVTVSGTTVGGAGEPGEPVEPVDAVVERVTVTVTGSGAGAGSVTGAGSGAVDGPVTAAVTGAGSGTVQDVGVFGDAVLSWGEVAVVSDLRFPKVQPFSPTYRDIVEPFDARKYTNPRLPIDLGVVSDVGGVRAAPNVLRMPLKWWDSDEVNIPREFLPMKDFLLRVFTYDKCHNPFYESQVAHVTHDTRVVGAGRTLRFPGWHGDDLQGGSFVEKEVAAHSYLLTTSPGTEFCLQPFFVGHLDDTYEGLFNEFDRQVLGENVYVTRPGHVYLMDPYSVHRTPVMWVEGLRTFLRVTFSTRNMLLPNNTVNPMFEGRQGEYDALPFPHLYESRWTQASDKSVPYRAYGLSR